MAGFSGRSFTLAIGDGASSETFAVIAGGRDITVTESEATVDTTSKDDSGVRQLLSGRILSAISVTATGVFKDSQTIADLRSEMRAGTHANYEIDIVDTDATTGGEKLTGAFRVTSIEHAGSYDGEVNYTINLESDGTITSS
jgi:TP901-1 family phage major tail protein